MKTSSLLVAAGACSCRRRCSSAASPATAVAARRRRGAPRSTAAASRATRSSAGCAPSSIGSSDGLGGNGRACADCHMPTDSFQLSPASVEARFQLLQWRRRWNPDADDPLFRPIDADDFRTNGDSAHDFSNLRQNGLVRITFPLPPNMRLIDPATNAPSDETFVDVWRSTPSVNDVALTGADTVNPWPRGPNADRRLPARRPRGDPAGAGAGGVHESRPGPQSAAAADAGRPGVVPAGPVHQPSRPRRCPTPCAPARCRCPIPTVR